MGKVMHDLVAGPSVWRGIDFAQNEGWIHVLTGAEQAELIEAVAHVKSKRQPCYEFGKADFPLPLLETAIARFLDELEDGRGFVLLRGIPIANLTNEDLSLLYWGLGVHLGTPLTQNRKGEKIVEIADRGVPYGKQVRGYTTDAQLMPHSDAADLVSLLCVRPAKTGGASCIASGMTIYNEIALHHPEYLDVLHRGFRHNMRGEGASGDPNEVTNNVIPVFSFFAGKLSCHFNRRLIEQGAEKTGHSLSALEKAAIDHVNALAMSPDIRFDMEFRTGDVQLLNNHVVLHARQAFRDDPAARHGRRLLRLWTNMPNGRPLAPEYADRTNNGPRGGMPVAPETDEPENFGR